MLFKGVKASLNRRYCKNMQIRLPLLQLDKSHIVRHTLEFWNILVSTHLQLLTGHVAVFHKRKQHSRRSLSYLSFLLFLSLCFGRGRGNTLLSTPCIPPPLLLYLISNIGGRTLHSSCQPCNSTGCSDWNIWSLSQDEVVLVMTTKGIVAVPSTLLHTWRATQSKLQHSQTLSVRCSTWQKQSPKKQNIPGEHECCIHVHRACNLLTFPAEERGTKYCYEEWLCHMGHHTETPAISLPI